MLVSETGHKRQEDNVRIEEEFRYRDCGEFIEMIILVRTSQFMIMESSDFNRVIKDVIRWPLSSEVMRCHKNDLGQQRSREA